MIKLKKLGTFYHVYKDDALLGKFTLDELLEVCLNNFQNMLLPRGLEGE